MKTAETLCLPKRVRTSGVGRLAPRFVCGLEGSIPREAKTDGLVLVGVGGARKTIDGERAEENSVSEASMEIA